jgi:Rrf2 family protein
MLSISSKCRYGLTALLELAEFHDQGLMQLKDISSRRNIPHQYLEQIFNRLTKAGIVQSVRGKNGGYRLADAPGNISALDVITTLEGRLELATPTEEAGNPDVINELFRQAEESLISTFSISLAELAQQRQLLRSNVMYHI